MTNRLIDTHIHTWNFKRATYDWLKGDTSILNRSYLVEEIASERAGAGITEGVLVQAANNFEDTDWMLEVAAQTDWITGVVGWVPLLEPGETEKALRDHYLSNNYFKGIRHLIHDESDPRWLLQEKVLESLKILADHKLPYDVVGVLPAHIQTALEVAEKVPGLTMVFDHLNQPPMGAKEKQTEWSKLMTIASGHPQFFVKISGLGTASKNLTGWNAEDIKPAVAFVLEKFGEGRCFCGGDWPVSLLAGSYSRTWSIYKQVLNDLLTESGKEKVFYKNAQQFYNL
jgi:L-fuconolactonase